MSFQIGGAILDFIVLSILRNKDEYGYILTQEVRQILDVSETAMYPALKRLQKSNFLTTYDMPYQGRNRRYYKITEEGLKELDLHIKEWNLLKLNMDRLLGENTSYDNR